MKPKELSHVQEVLINELSVLIAEYGYILSVFRDDEVNELIYEIHEKGTRIFATGEPLGIPILLVEHLKEYYENKREKFVDRKLTKMEKMKVNIEIITFKHPDWCFGNKLITKCQKILRGKR